MTITQITLTSGTTWTVPDDFNPDDNTIECIEGGQDGEAGSNSTGKTAGAKGGDGGNGGHNAYVVNFQASPGETLTVNIGARGASQGATWLSNTGTSPTTTSHGVRASHTGAIGDVTHSGASGAAGASASGSTGGSGGRGGGAAGNNGNASGRSPGSMSPAWTGVGPGTGGLGGVSNQAGAGIKGGDGTVYGAGGGGGSGGDAGRGGNIGGAKGLGAQGIIVIRYTPKEPSSGVQFRAYVFG